MAEPGKTSPLIYLIAGEPSGDLLGARLMRALKTETGGAVRFAGLGGALMQAEGLESFFPIDELAVMGLLEVVPHIRRLLRRIDETVADVVAAQPDALVTIDAPAFSLRVSRRLAGGEIILVHYVAPSVWAWKPGRARKIARFLDHLLALLPFEPPYFEAHGLATSFVGYPAIEEAGRATDAKGFRRRHGIAGEAPVICALPGSRVGEVRRHTRLFTRTLQRLADRHTGLTAIVPTLPALRRLIERAAKDWPLPTIIVGQEEKYDAFAAADVALAASGTVSVELAVAQVPCVVTYRLNWLTALIVGAVVRTKYVSPVNIVLGRPAQPEFLQHRATPANLSRAISKYLDDPEMRRVQAADCLQALTQMGLGSEKPSTRAARAVLAAIDAGRAGQSSYTAPTSRSK
ncbi:MAG: lipid-A-disaccharide synthase [Alphaproteobacteria bacterium]